MLHRLETHAGPHNEALEEPVWTLTAFPSDELSTPVIWGYLRAESHDGFGQAQVLGVVSDPSRSWPAIAASNSGEADFAKWVAEHLAEVMYDTCRRALQAQAANMDFTFPLEKAAPSATLQIEKPRAAQRTAPKKSRKGRG
ncbi:hypothetical protein DDQ50_13785 [Amnibacterium flavum]|uniref:Uncharacterized protein n=2 Tax=Amnibacterium flavum TaxID=2173173 RepID=A0A2V1HQ54_9MICO|nr:hypothetical protein DDQ50_13785 [Amnibacterium flavum]